MFHRKLALAATLVFLSFTVRAAEDEHPTLAIGSPAPDFSLPGIDGKTHSLTEYKNSQLLAIVFTCNHCPTAQLYETRIKKLVDDFSAKERSFRRNPAERSARHPSFRVRLHRRQRQYGRHEDPRRVSPFQLPLPK